MKIDARAALAVSTMLLILGAAVQHAAAERIPQISQPVVGKSRTATRTPAARRTKTSPTQPGASPTDAAPTGQRPSSATRTTTNTVGTEATPRNEARSAKAPAPRNLTAAQSKRADELAKWLLSLSAGTAVSAEQRAAFRTTLLATAIGPMQADPRIVEDLGIDLTSAMSFGNLTNAEKEALAREVCFVLNSAPLPLDEVMVVVGRAERRLQSGGVTTADVQKVTGDLKAVAYDLQHRQAALAAAAPTPTPAPPPALRLRRGLPSPHIGPEAEPAERSLPAPRME